MPAYSLDPNVRPLVRSTVTLLASAGGFKETSEESRYLRREDSSPRSCDGRDRTNNLPAFSQLATMTQVPSDFYLLPSVPSIWALQILRGLYPLLQVERASLCSLSVTESIKFWEAGSSPEAIGRCDPKAGLLSAHEDSTMKPAKFPSSRRITELHTGETAEWSNARLQNLVCPL